MICLAEGLTDEVRDRIDELVDAFLTRLDKSGVSLTVCDRLRDALRDQLANEGLREFVAARVHEPATRTLDGLVLAYDPRLEMAELTYKN